MSEGGNGNTPAQPSSQLSEVSDKISQEVKPQPPQEQASQAVTPEEKKQAGLFTNIRQFLTDWGRKPKSIEKSPDDSILQTQMDRRKFLKLAGTTSAAVAVAAGTRSASNMIPEERVVNPEGLEYIDNTIFLDFAPEKPIQGIRQSSYPVNAALEKRLLGDKYRSPVQLMREFGVDFVRKGFQKLELFKSVLKKYPQFGLLHGGLEEFSTHGEVVTTAHRKALALFGYDTNPAISPIQSALIGGSSGSDYTDKLGNKGVTIEVQAEPLIKQLQNTSQPVVSMSFQMGKLHLVNVEKDLHVNLDFQKFKELQKRQMDIEQIHKVFYENKLEEVYLFDRKSLRPDLRVVNGIATTVFIDVVTGNEATEGFRKMSEEEYTEYEKKQQLELYKQSHILEEIHKEDIDIKIKGAYSGEEGEQNIQELFKLVDAFEDKLFIVAAGNYSDDIRPLREKFKDRWPKNLLIVGQWNSDENRPRAYKGATLGADIYVDNKDFGYEEDRKFSSISTACLSAAANILAKKGYSIEQVKEKLLELTTETEFETVYSDTLAFEPIDFDKYVAGIGKVEKQTSRVFNYPRFQQLVKAA